jgi:hypothetical protein
VFICDICGNEFDRATLDAHFTKTVQEAASINGVIWSGKLVTFDASGMAWCPYCFKDADAMRSGRRSIHKGKRTAYLRAPNLGVAYKCKCGRHKSFSCQSVNIYTGLELVCVDCGAILWVPPTIFDHSKPRRPGEASLRSNYTDLMLFVRFRKSELDQKLREGLITEQQHREELKRRDH